VCQRAVKQLRINTHPELTEEFSSG
jgi:hypothetical protein